MFISYTSKRRHRASIVGTEMAPSMTFTNWTAGNSATLSNDPSGNLKVAYNGVPNPFAYKAFTTVVGSAYRVKLQSVADGTAVLPVVVVGTTAAGNELGEIDLRDVTATNVAANVEFYIRAATTTTYLSMLCATATANYALFAGASFVPVSTVGHAVLEVLRDDLTLGTAAYTANNSTLSVASIHGQAYSDSSLKVTNAGAVFGEALRAYAFPTVAGRSYKASLLWVPHSCLSSTLRVGSTSGGSELGSKLVTHDINDIVTTPFFKAASGLKWDFTNTADGWVSENITASPQPTYIFLTATSVNPRFTKESISFSGLQNRYVTCRFRRTSAAWNDYLRFFYKTASHNYSASYYALANVTALALSEYTVIVWDLWQLAAGGDDWKESIVTGIRLELTTTNAATFDIDWIAVGNLNPLSVTFQASGDLAYLKYSNSNESNASSYYSVPKVTQLDSTYTLSQTGVETLDPVDEYIVNETRTIAGVSYGLYDRTDEGWSIVSDKIGDAAKADWDEFFASCAALETFRFDPAATTDTTTTKTCELVPGSQKLTRISKVGLWRAQFKVRVAA